MNERTAEHPPNDQALGKAPRSHLDRYADYSEAQLDAGMQWLRDQGHEAWSKRLKIEGDYLLGDFRGVPPVVRQMIRDQVTAIQLMTPEQWAGYWALDVTERARLVDQVLMEAGR